MQSLCAHVLRVCVPKIAFHFETPRRHAAEAGAAAPNHHSSSGELAAALSSIALYVSSPAHNQFF